MIDLIFDTETTGFPQWKLPNDDPEQPELMQLAIMLAKGDEILLEWEHLVYCEKEATPGAFTAHGISREMCQEAGVSLSQALEFFCQRVREADRIIAHNFAFDKKIMLIAFAKSNIYNPDKFSPQDFLSKPNICTMLTATNIVKVPHPVRGGWKWPTLQESYRALVDKEGFEGAHRAGVDVSACHKVLRSLERMNAEFRSAP